MDGWIERYGRFKIDVLDIIDFNENHIVFTDTYVQHNIFIVR